MNDEKRQPGEIHELDSITVDQIAAGEVVEKPVNAIKELIENAIDAGAKHITVEIEDGGISMLRVTDDGCGIRPGEVRKAFLRHATSKIDSIRDLMDLHSLGFRGEALSSLAAVSRVEMITKTEGDLTGTRYLIEGGKEILFEEVGAPDGTTVVARELFYNTPARGKFLKKPQTEGAHVGELVERLALARPDISFRFVSNHQDRFHTSGNGDLKENIYRIFGRDVAAQIRPIEAVSGGMRLTGYLGEPAVNRGSRAYELFFVNGRYVKDRVLQMALEDGYRGYVMLHRFPFAVLFFEVPPDEVDVNVHPSKMEVRFHSAGSVAGFVTRSVANELASNEMIPDALLDEKEEKKEGLLFAAENDRERRGSYTPAEPFESSRHEIADRPAAYGLEAAPVVMSDDLMTPVRTPGPAETDAEGGRNAVFDTDQNNSGNSEADGLARSQNETADSGSPSPAQTETPGDGGQLRFLSEESRKEYRILGQLFGTYWVIACRDSMMLMDQHAAHEKVNYERMMKRYHERSAMSQMVEPPVIMNLSPVEESLVKKHMDTFLRLGFEIEEFGEKTVAIRGIPVELYGAGNERTLFRDVLDELTEERDTQRDPAAVTGRIASMACKASVKGNTRMSLEEVNALLDELLTLDNPYHCPHGRPTVITMSRYELDKRFRRVVE